MNPGFDQRDPDCLKGNRPMKHLVRCCAVLLAVLMTAVSLGFAEDEAPDRRLILVHEAVINPDRSADHEALIKEFLALKIDHSMPFATFSLEDGRYFYATPLDGYAGVEAFESAWMETMAKMGDEKMAEFTAKSEGISDHHHDSLWWERLDLSYVPDGMEESQGESKFRFWGWFYGKPGHEMQIEEYFKKFVALYEKHDLDMGWYTYMGSIGTDAPVYVWSEIGESEAAYLAKRDELAKKLGEEATNLWIGMQKHARELRFDRGHYRPELSYTPKAEE
jgi:hypothetical protein